MSTKAAAAKDDHATDNDVNQNTENKEVCMFLYATYVCSYVHNFKEWYILVLYRLPDFRSIPISDYFTFQTADISIQYRLLQYLHTIKLSYKFSGSVTSTRLLNYLILINRYCNLKIYRYRLSRNSPIICCFRL